MTPTPVPGGSLVSNVTVSSGLTYVVGTFDAGELLFIDRPYLFANPFPSIFQGQEYIRAANADKNGTGASFLTFTVSADAQINVLFDARATSLPAWLDGTWTATGELVSTTDSGTDRDVYSKVFSSGTVALGGNDDAPSAGANSMYNVVVIPVAGLTPTPTPTATSTPVPTATPTSTPIPTATATATPTPTPTSTSTPTPGPTSTPTATPTATPTPPPILTVADGAGSVSQTIQVEIELAQVFDGISGFVLDAVVGDPAIASITNVTLPNYGFQFVTGAPGSSVSMLMADFSEILQGQIPSVVIATLDVQLLAAGSTQITLSVNQLDSDLGIDLIPGATLNPGTIDAN